MISKLKAVIRRILPKGAYLSVQKLYQIYKYVFSDKIFFGLNNPDKTFYIVYLTYPGGGMGNILKVIISHLMYADKKGYIPVVDLENYITFMNEDYAVNGTKNAWEYYFKQPGGYSLSDVYKSKNVYKCGFGSAFYPISRSTTLRDKDIANIHRCIEKYVRFQDHIEEYIDEKAKDIFAGGKRVLGVASRGTDYVKMRPPGHWVQPSVEQLIEITKEQLNKWGKDKPIDAVFLITEEQATLDAFKEAFKEKLLYTEHPRHLSYKADVSIPDVRFNRENDKYLTNLEYLTDLMILSRCDYLLGTQTTGFLIAFYMNGGKYTDTHVIDLGLY